MNCCKSTPSRRTFIAAGVATTAAVTLAACSSALQQEKFSDGVFTQAIELTQLPPGSSMQLTVGGSQVLLYRESENTVHAYSAVCTHQGCIVGASEDASAPFVCPCHASHFDKATGEATAGPAKTPLTRHETAIENGWILVEVEETH